MPRNPYPPFHPESDVVKEPAASVPTMFNLSNTGLMADNGYSYPSEDELRNIFASSCIEAVSRKLHLSSGETYKHMKRAELFRDLIYPCYEALHSQSREVVTDDIVHALQIREAKLKDEEA